VLDPRWLGEYFAAVETRFVSYEELQRDKRADREEDARRLRLGLVTPEQLQAEYSLIPLDAEVTIIDFCETVNRYYDK
jgi:hypothetical protein